MLQGMPLQNLTFKNLLSKIFGRKAESFSIRTRNTFKFLDGFFDNFLSLNSGQRNNRKFIEEGYGSNPIVYMVVNRIAEMAASLPRVVEGGGRARELYEEPNSFQTKHEFEVQQNTELLVTGDVFLILIEGIGAGQEWRVAQSSNMEIVVENGMPLYYWEYFGTKQVRRELEDVLHIKYANIISDQSSGSNAHFYGMSPLQPSWPTVVASNEIYNAERYIFKNKGIAGMVTNDTEVPLLKDERERIQKEFDETTGGSDKFNKIAVSNNKLRFIQMGMSPQDLKLIENQISKLRTICSVYGLDSTLFNDPANKTFNNRKESEISAFTNAYLPLAKKVDEAKSRFLTKRFGQPFSVEVDREQIEIFQREEIDQEGQPENE